MGEAQEFVEYCATCIVCGRAHKYRPGTTRGWADPKDHHPYRPRAGNHQELRDLLAEMTESPG